MGRLWGKAMACVAALAVIAAVVRHVAAVHPQGWQVGVLYAVLAGMLTGVLLESWYYRGI